MILLLLLLCVKIKCEVNEKVECNVHFLPNAAARSLEVRVVLMGPLLTGDEAVLLLRRESGKSVGEGDVVLVTVLAALRICAALERVILEIS